MVLAAVSRRPLASPRSLPNPRYLRSPPLPRSPLRHSLPRRFNHDQAGHGQGGKDWSRWALAGGAATGFVAAVVMRPGGSKVQAEPAVPLEASNAWHKAPAKPASSKEEPRRTIFHRIYLVFENWIVEPLGTARRFVHLFLIFFPVILTSPVLLLELIEVERGGRGGKKRKSERATTRWWYSLLVRAMESGGPTFIKLAQWAGSRTDLFPAALCARFSRLHSNGKPHSFSHTKRVLEHAFDRPFSEIFVEFDQTPLGIGAVAQVYKGTLNPDLLPPGYLDPKHADDPNPLVHLSTQLTQPSDSGSTTVPSSAVAIKILHPSVHRMIGRDLKIMAFFASALNMLPGAEWLSFPEEVAVFGDLMRSQLDLTVEAHNLDRFEENFTHRKTVSFPRPLNEYTTKTVLVEEHEDAVPLKAFLREGGGPFDNRIANIGLDAFLSMLLIDNFVHSDLHPGNIMVKFYKPTTGSILRSLLDKLLNRPETDAGHENVGATTEIAHRLRKLSHDRAAWLAELDQLDQAGYQPELVFIDTGLVTELNDVNRRNFLDLFGAVADFDGYRAGKLMIERCRTPDLVIDDETFALKMQHLVLRVKSKSFSLAQIRIGDVLSEVLQNVRQHHVKLEADFVNTVISILLLEGIGRQLDPDMDLFKSALPILRRLGSQMNAMDTLRSGVSSKQVGAMLKLWVWIEARQMASIATSEVDRMIRYDLLMPNV